MYIAAATANDRTRFFDVVSLTGISQVANKYPSTTVVFVNKKQRDAKAPNADELFPLLLARAKPIRTDTGWHNCSLDGAKRLILNVLQNPNASIETFTRASKDGNENTSPTHGYVYAFANKKYGWLKVGMTSKNEEEQCWFRIRDYVKAHSLPSDGWDFVGFIPCMQAQKLEALIHRKLRKFRVAKGKSQELFKCSLSVYLSVLDLLDEFVEANSPDIAAEATRQEREQQEREAQQRAYAAAQEHARREREHRERKEREQREQREEFIKAAQKTQAAQANAVRLRNNLIKGPGAFVGLVVLAAVLAANAPQPTAQHVTTPQTPSPYTPPYTAPAPPPPTTPTTPPSNPAPMPAPPAYTPPYTPITRQIVPTVKTQHNMICDLFDKANYQLHHEFERNDHDTVKLVAYAFNGDVSYPNDIWTIDIAAKGSNTFWSNNGTAIAYNTSNSDATARNNSVAIAQGACHLH
jgi:hypothetical protein